MQHGVDFRNDELRCDDGDGDDDDVIIVIMTVDIYSTCTSLMIKS